MDADRFRVRTGDRKPIERDRTDFTKGFGNKDAALAHLEDRLPRLDALQEQLYAQHRYALLVILQGMDTAGKDSCVEHVLTSLSPQGLQVHNFKQPSAEELTHDFLWRASRDLPARGQVAVFNRSYYEEVLIVRVHPELLEKENLPPEHVKSTIWQQRYDDINAFERRLWRNGTIITKFFLNISRGEQEERLLARIEDPAKNWKFSPGDLPERAKWKSYMSAYEEALAATSSAHAPWHVIPADHKWFAHAAIAEILFKTLSGLDLRFPPLTSVQRRELAQARQQLRRRKKSRS